MAIPLLHLSINEGEFAAIAGLCACGKSSTMRMTAFIEAVSAGTAEIAARVAPRAAPKACVRAIETTPMPTARIWMPTETCHMRFASPAMRGLKPGIGRAGPEPERQRSRTGGSRWRRWHLSDLASCPPHTFRMFRSAFRRKPVRTSHPLQAVNTISTRAEFASSTASQDLQFPDHFFKPEGETK